LTSPWPSRLLCSSEPRSFQSPRRHLTHHVGSRHRLPPPPEHPGGQARAGEGDQGSYQDPADQGELILKTKMATVDRPKPWNPWNCLWGQRTPARVACQRPSLPVRARACSADPRRYAPSADPELSPSHAVTAPHPSQVETTQAQASFRQPASRYPTSPATPAPPTPAASTPQAVVGMQCLALTCSSPPPARRSTGRRTASARPWCTRPSTPATSRRSWWQGLTLVLFSAQPKPLMSANRFVPH